MKSHAMAQYSLQFQYDLDYCKIYNGMIMYGVPWHQCRVSSFTMKPVALKFRISLSSRIGLSQPLPIRPAEFKPTVTILKNTNLVKNRLFRRLDELAYS